MISYHISARWKILSVFFSVNISPNYGSRFRIRLRKMFYLYGLSLGWVKQWTHRSGRCCLDPRGSKSKKLPTLERKISKILPKKRHFPPENSLFYREFLIHSRFYLQSVLFLGQRLVSGPCQCEEAEADQGRHQSSGLSSPPRATTQHYTWNTMEL